MVAAVLAGSKAVLYPVPTGIGVVERRIADGFGFDDGCSRLREYTKSRSDLMAYMSTKNMQQLSLMRLSRKQRCVIPVLPIRRMEIVTNGF